MQRRKVILVPVAFHLEENAQKLCNLNGNETNYVLVVVQQPQDVAQVTKQIAQISGVNALSNSEIGQIQ